MSNTKPARKTRTPVRKPAAKPATKAPAARPAAKPAAERTKTKPKARKALTGLDAAAKVLTESGTPMSCAQIMARIMELSLWSTKGRTPAATLSAAIGREIKAKGKDSRFRKAGRGTFTAHAA